MTCPIPGWDFNKRLQLRYGYDGNASNFCDLDRSIGDEFVKLGTAYADHAAGLRDAHRDRFDDLHLGTALFPPARCNDLSLMSAGSDVLLADLPASRSAISSISSAKSLAPTA